MNDVKIISTVSGLKLSSKKFEEIRQAINERTNDKVTILDSSNNNLGNLDKQVLFAVIKHMISLPLLQRLDLSSNNLNRGFYKRTEKKKGFDLIDAFKNNSENKLISLNLNHNQLALNDNLPLLVKCCSANIRQLYLAGNSLGIKNAESLYQTLSNLSTYTVFLDLSENELTVVSNVNAIYSALASKRVKTLLLQNNKLFENESTSDIIDMIKQTPQEILSIDFSNNHLGNNRSTEDLVEIIKAFHNSHLIFIDLSGNSLFTGRTNKEIYQLLKATKESTDRFNFEENGCTNGTNKKNKPVFNEGLFIVHYELACKIKERIRESCNRYDQWYHSEKSWRGANHLASFFTHWTDELDLPEIKQFLNVIEVEDDYNKLVKIIENTILLDKKTKKCDYRGKLSD